ncbi:TorF family putative porin [Sphingosinicella sp. LHD-64]|uniref:TorF family putative porin n=1 Tax=Sphingosinicella sp. LHD-64 TaxID=3072139 RepID=UPI00280F81AE|nr:TorF family putative porin [Sphingosinicella sp. LHD-64]MDQ8756936.1 TorF family putative porin [Sphingosinicella sp. LHD-64]
MLRFCLPAALAASAFSTPSLAQTEAPRAFTISGSAAIASDYRFRGISQTDENMAVQGGLTLTHRSGFYVGTWGSNLSGWGTFGGANMELDLIGGYRARLSDNATLDVGLVWYMYPGGADETDFAEPYVKLTGTTGPATLTAGVAYAPSQQALGRWYFTGADAAAGVYNDPGDKEDNLYVWGDGAVAIAGTPVTAKAHIGYTSGNSGLGPNATSLAPTGEYWDWSVGADVTWRNLTFNVSYVDTDISRSEAAYLQPSFSLGQDGTGSIADGAVVVSLTASF